MFCNRLLSLKKTLNFSQIYGNYLRLNRKYDSFLYLSQTKRCVHSSNTHEIDFLFTYYKLSKIGNGRQSYGQKSSLHYFNTIEDFHFESDRDRVINTLKQTLDIRKNDAINLVKNYPNLAEMSTHKLEKQILFLFDLFYLKVDQLLSCPWILYLPIGFIRERLNPFSKNIKKDHLVLLLLPLKTYETISKKIKNKKISEDIYSEFNKKLNLFTSELNLICEEFCELMHENTYLFSYSFERLKAVMDLVIDAGVTPDTILSDIRIFTHNIELMKQRIAICTQHNMPIKIWMLRAPEDTFNVTLRRYNENKNVLKDYDNNIQFIASKLSCDTNIIHSIMKRYPLIVKISPKKLSEVLSVLLDYGFTPFHIIDTPKILFSSVESISKRMEELKYIEIKPKSLKILTLSEKEYNKTMDQLKNINDNNGNDLLLVSEHL